MEIDVGETNHRLRSLRLTIAPAGPRSPLRSMADRQGGQLYQPDFFRAQNPGWPKKCCRSGAQGSFPASSSVLRVTTLQNGSSRPGTGSRAGRAIALLKPIFTHCRTLGNVRMRQLIEQVHFAACSRNCRNGSNQASRLQNGMSWKHHIFALHSTEKRGCQ